MEFNEEQQAFVDKLVGDARVKAREKAQSDFEAKLQAEKEAAERQAMVDQAKWKELAESSSAKLQELEALAPQLEKYEGLIADMLQSKVKALGDSAQKAVEALPESMGAVEKLEWLSKNVELFQAAGDGVGTPKRPKQKPESQTPSGATRTRFGKISL